MSLRVGLIGAGRVAQLHARALADTGDADVRFVCDPRRDAAAKLAERFGAAVHDDHRVALEDESVDAVVIAVPHDQHASVAIDALQTGCHVYMDKPLALNVDDARRVRAVAQESAGRFMLCHNLLFHPAVQQAKQVVGTGVIGRPTITRSWSHGWLDLAPGDFRLDPAATGGGAWVDCGSHLLYVLEDLLGPIETVEVLPARTESRLGAEDAAAGIARFQSGSLATLYVSYSDRLPGHEGAWPAGWATGYELHGTDGMVRVDVSPEPALTIYDGKNSGERRSLDTDFYASFAGAMQEFVAAVREDRPPGVGADDGLRMMELLRGAVGVAA